ncbi:Glycosyltransferase involved in cell wall bisynthesis [Pseudomonas pohangensis]|uniref:Glycosyltransferase involved in cell wall bisynthesis n=1 Tax=Pseudomonas pohangensis TaxID=364197 RepID=A0A1H2H1I7_9PSED|nr:glycosyltransferase family 4 protein [Pseudomonas pohangensis]SDU25478.1 Glycosyltransferase involved in cell wall bisynthesis [Pseudomonas pohangensis]
MIRRILVLTFFYPPDLAAGSFRASALVKALQEVGGSNLHIDVLTTQPNRYQQHADKTSSIEAGDGLWIRRISLPKYRNGFFNQAVAFIRYARKASRLASEAEYDLVVATSSRLMTAALGRLIAYRQGAKLYLDIRDIFVESISGLFESPLSNIFTAFFSALERWTVSRADKVNLVSKGFLNYFKPKYPEQCFSIHSNGVDAKFVNLPLKALRSNDSPSPLQIFYAGNVGDGQGLHLIVPELAKQLKGRAYFRIVGAGGQLEALQEAVLVNGLDNVEIISPVARCQLVRMYRDADILFLHLNTLKAFERVLPSKLFEYAATGKPIWAGVGGYAAEFIDREISNAVTFTPCDALQAVQCLNGLCMESVERTSFVETYSRERIMRAMANDILQLLTRKQ